MFLHCKLDQSLKEPLFQLAYKKDQYYILLLMSAKLQEGIYHRSKPPIGNSFCLLSLKAHESVPATDVGTAILKIWDRLSKLKQGITADLDIDTKHRKIGNLTVLIGYGSKLFQIHGLRKRKPTNFDDKWNFLDPKVGGGGPVLTGSGFSYGPSVIENHLLSDDIVLQFIADSEFFVNRAVVEVWKQLQILREKKMGQPFVNIGSFYSGFQRPDRRNWLGFHDGVSNLKANERPLVISIDPRDLTSNDKWTAHGTYLAFMRINIDLDKWERTSTIEQELLIGRHKLTGCPLIRIDANGKPVKDSRCPVPGTTEVMDPGNESFRDTPPFGITLGNKILGQSHIGRIRPLDRIPVADKNSLRIFRQGFEFLADSRGYPGFTAGLNFVSFQNTPERLFRSLTYRKFRPQPVSKGPIQVLDDYMYVTVAGIFLVPPGIQNEPFPGAQMFFNSRELNSLSAHRIL